MSAQMILRGALASLPRITCARAIGTSFNPQRVGNSLEYVWRSKWPLLYGYMLYRDKARDRLPSVLDIRRAFVSGRLKSVCTCESVLQARKELASEP
jgi:hypothetical protein